MASHEQLYVRTADREAVRATGYDGEARGEWLQLAIDQPELALAKDLSRRLATATVWASIETTAEQVWIVAFDHGEQIRELRHADGKWHKHGKLGGEAKALAKWLRVRALSASPDGYDVIACVLGEDVPPIEELAETRQLPEGWRAQNLFFTSELAAELSQLASTRDAAMSQLLVAAWHAGKRELFERELPQAPLLGAPPPAPPHPAEPDPAFIGAPHDVEPLARGGRKVECKLAFPSDVLDELRAFAVTFDRSLSWTLGEAYLLARPRLIGW